MRSGAVSLVLCAGCFFTPERPSNVDAGAEPDAPDLGISADAYTGPNYMFVTSSTYFGNDLADVGFADAKCRDAASSAELPGTFVAWWSSRRSPGIDARDRLANARGWIRTDGLPFADTLGDLVAGRIYTPPRFDETGKDIWRLAPERLVYTGTNAQGLATNVDCASGAQATIGVTDATKVHWTQVGGQLACDQPFHLYCFATDNQVEVSPPPLPAGAKIAFVSSIPVGLNTNQGAAAWDIMCTQRGAMFNNGTYKAFVATTTRPARQALPTSNDVWYRRDGFKLVDVRDFQSLTIPLNVTENGLYVVGSVYSGASDFDSLGQNETTCDDWRNTSGPNHDAGTAQRSERHAWRGVQTACSSDNLVYCFQQ